MLKKIKSYNNLGFTIVELLVVIVVIGVLASISIVSYTGISQKATAVALKTDLVNAKKQISLYQVVYGTFPTALDINKCPSAPAVDSRYCIKPSSNNDYTYYSSNGVDFSLTATNSGGMRYDISDELPPQALPELNTAD